MNSLVNKRVNKIVDKGEPLDIASLVASFEGPCQGLFGSLNKLSSYGMKNKVLSWIKTWLGDRKQNAG